MFDIRRNLATKLSLGILLMAIPIFVLSLGLFFIQSRRVVLTEALEHANSVHNTTLQRIHNYMTTIETATNANDWVAVENLHPDTLLSLSNRIVRLNPHVNGCSFTTEPNLFPQYGRYFSAYSVRVKQGDGRPDSIITVREAEYEYFDKVWYKTPHDLGHACWVDPFDDYNEGTLSAVDLIASYCKPLRTADGRFIGVASTDLSLRELSNLISAEHPYPHSYFVMIGSEGQYFIHPDTAKLFKKTIFSDADPGSQTDIITLGHEMTKGRTGNMNVKIKGESCLVCYQPVAGTDWSLALICPESDVLKYYHLLAYIIIFLIIVGLLVITLLCRMSMARAIKPVRQLVEQTQLIAAGKYDEVMWSELDGANSSEKDTMFLRTSVANRWDVVSRLQNSFATMLHSLKAHVNEISQANDEAARRNEELVQTNQLAEEAARQKNIFIQNVTHQIRTPLNIILGFAQVLRDNAGQMQEEEMRSIADIMNHNSMLLSRMSSMLNDSSTKDNRIPVNVTEEVRLNELSQEVLAEVRIQYPNVNFIFSTSLPDNYTIHSDRLYLFRSMRELFYNSVKYSDGTHVQLTITANGTHVILTFEDHGPGIAASDLERLYQPFTKVDDLSEGLGLGLPLTKNHITNLGGTLTLDTDYQKGCRFVVQLPNR